MFESATNYIEVSLNMKLKQKSLIIGSVGGFLEWYEFTIFAFLSPIFAKLYFHNLPHWEGVIIMYCIWGISYLSRPIGGILYGHFGDKIGRKKHL